MTTVISDRNDESLKDGDGERDRSDRVPAEAAKKKSGSKLRKRGAAFAPVGATCL